jgi:hypothetical protein
MHRHRNVELVQTRLKKGNVRLFTIKLVLFCLRSQTLPKRKQTQSNRDNDSGRSQPKKLDFLAKLLDLKT